MFPYRKSKIVKLSNRCVVAAMTKIDPEYEEEKRKHILAFNRLTQFSNILCSDLFRDTHNNLKKSTFYRYELTRECRKLAKMYDNFSIIVEREVDSMDVVDDISLALKRAFKDLKEQTINDFLPLCEGKEKEILAETCAHIHLALALSLFVEHNESNLVGKYHLIKKRGVLSSDEIIASLVNIAAYLAKNSNRSISMPASYVVDLEDKAGDILIKTLGTELKNVSV